MIDSCPNITQISTRKAIKTITHLTEPNQTQLKCPMWHKNTVVEHRIRGHMQNEENSKDENKNSSGTSDL